MLDLVLFQELKIFALECSAGMVALLVPNVTHHAHKLRVAMRKGAEARPPVSNPEG